MDEKVINELIKQLTENLEKVEAARQQVEKTVKAYDVLKTEVSKYTTELSFITQNVRTMISQLEIIKENFLGNISTEIIDKINENTVIITSAINGVSSQISSLCDLVDNNTRQINENIKQSHEQIDSVLSYLRTEINNLDLKVVSCSNQIAVVATSIQSFSEKETIHYEAIVRRLEEQESLFNTEFEVVRKQNKIFSITIIVLLIAIACVFYFTGRI